MFAKIKAWWAESQRKSEMRLIRKTYLRKTGKSLDEYTDVEVEQAIKFGALIKKYELSPDDVTKFLSQMEQEQANENTRL